MKKCPKCGADIEENARFCLYCMTSFEQKEIVIAQNGNKNNKKLWLIIIAAVLVLLIICCTLSFNFVGPTGTYVGDTSAENSDKNSTTNTTASDSSAADSDSQQNGNSYISGDSSSSDSENKSSGKSSESSQGSSSNKKTNSTGSSQGSSSQTSVQNENSGSDSTSQGSTSSTISTVVTYTYIEATSENCYPPGQAQYEPENAIVITGVSGTASGGNYIIPEKIDGKKVGAIMPSAFSNSKICSSVKSVTLPSTVRTVWSGAFSKCTNLTDIYIKSSVIELYKDAFPALSNRNATLTIHCKKDCRNFNFYYYRNIHDDYNAQYKEWNG